MGDDSGIKWLFLDLNSFFASVEQQDRPELRGRPVAVVPARTDSTCAIAASYEAKAYGIKTGTPIYEARRMCPKLVCVPARHDIYVDYHHRVIDEAIKHVPINKIWSIDELSSRLPPRQQNRDEAVAAALRLKDGLKRNVGDYIKCSIGLAPNSFLAKVATDMKKPDGLTVLSAPELPGRLLRLKLIDLPGINVRMEARLRKAGISTMADLWNTSPKQARQAWGSVAGERFWYNLHGMDIPDLPTKNTTIGHSRVLDPQLRHPEAARLVARRLTVKAASRLRRKEFFATVFYFSARATDGQRWASEARLPPSQDNFTFLRALDEMWREMDDWIVGCLDDSVPAIQSSNHPIIHLKKVSVGFHGLCRREDITPDLFDSASEDYQALARKNEALSAVMDGLNARYGAETLRLGVSPRTDSGYVGTKIAFARIPDKEEFWE